MKKLWAIIGILAAIVAVIGVHFGFHPVDASGTLSLCVDWVKGFTGHLDGLSLALAPAALTGLKQKRAKKIKEARTLLDAAGENDLTEEQRSQYDALMAEVDTIGAQIEREERMAELERGLGERTPVETVEGGEEQTPAEQPEQRGGQRGGAPQGGQGGVRTGRDRQREARMAFNTLQMMHGLTTRNTDLMRSAQRELARDGWYGPEAQQRAAGDYYSTLVDADGAILLPTVVANEIERIGNVYGVARLLCNPFTNIVGTFKAPAATGTLNASAVAEGGVISSSKRAFQSVTLNPKKWALIVPWTYEANLEAGPRILEDAQFAIGLGFARSEDDAMFNGDGTSTYNSIDGILSANRASVAEYVLPATNTSFDDITITDLKLIPRKIPAVLRAMASYVFHPDMEAKLSDLRDGDGRLVYAFNSTTGVATLNGRPVRYTEVLPSISDDDVSTTFGVYGAFGMWKMALGQGMTSEELREGTIKDADTGADINLATQDLRALKVRQFIDMDCNFEEAFCKISTPAA